jgi:hypothetical protein
MKSVAAALLIATTLFAADDPGGWTAAKWGMSLDQIRQAVPSAADLTTPEPARTLYIGGKKFLAILGVDPLDIAGFAWRAHFLLDRQKLFAVVLMPGDKTATSVQEFSRVEGLLVEKYGRPFERHVGSATEFPDIRSAQWSFPTTTVTLTYTDYRPRLAMESLDLEYVQRSTTTAPL